LKPVLIEDEATSDERRAVERRAAAATSPPSLFRTKSKHNYKQP
jgi:hypothetical protein